MNRLVALAMAAGAACVSAQVPAAVPLPASDVAPFRAEVARVEWLLATAADKATLTYAMARTFALGEQWPEAMAWLRKAVELKAGLDPSRDAAFKTLRGTKEFEALLDAVREATPEVSHSARAFAVAEGDLAPESVAYDARAKFFYFGSLRKAKVVRCSGAGKCSDFAVGLGTVLGLKARGDSLWVLSNAAAESALIRFDLATGRVVRRYAVAGEHLFNDLVVTRAGEVYLTDTRGGAVWHLAKGSAELVRLAGRFEFANGIAISDDGSALFVATYPEGVYMDAQGAMDRDALNAMMRVLLTDRFKMAIHSETRPVDAYTLMAVKPKLTKADPSTRTGCTRQNVGALPLKLVCQNITMAQFAEQLQSYDINIFYPVVDGTGLEGAWDFTLSYDLILNMPARFAADMAARGGAAPAVAAQAAEPSGQVSMVDAIAKQLGLKLETHKRPEKVLVLDHIEEKPTEN